MRATLLQPVPPGGEVELSVAFEDKLPKVFARAGYAGQFHMRASGSQVGRLRTGEGLELPPIPLNSEFYSDFGVYDVAVTLPDDFIVGATGVAWRETKAGGKKTVFLHAEDVTILPSAPPRLPRPGGGVGGDQDPDPHAAREPGLLAALRRCGTKSTGAQCEVDLEVPLRPDHGGGSPRTARAPEGWSTHVHHRHGQPVYRRVVSFARDGRGPRVRPPVLVWDER